MPLHESLITAGPGSTIPITGGAATSGPIRTDINFAPVRIGGIFDRSSGGNGTQANLLPIISLAAVAVLAFVLFRMRR